MPRIVDPIQQVESALLQAEAGYRELRAIAEETHETSHFAHQAFSWLNAVVGTLKLGVYVSPDKVARTTTERKQDHR